MTQSVILPGDSYFGTYWHDLCFILAVVAVLFCARYVLEKYILQPLSTIILNSPDNKDDAKLYQETQRKALDSMWKVIIYSILTVWEFSIALQQTWLTNHRDLWSGCYKLPCEEPIGASSYFLTMFQISHYIFATYGLYFWEYWRSDWHVLTVHHVVTMVLVFSQYHINITKVGVLIMMLHDMHDVLLESAKVFIYMKWEIVANSLFFVFVITWFAARVFYLPVYVIHSTWFHSKERAEEVSENISPYWEVLNGLLIGLWLVHLYWSYLIVKVLQKVIQNEGLEDEREKKQS